MPSPEEGDDEEADSVRSLSTSSKDIRGGSGGSDEVEAGDDSGGVSAIPPNHPPPLNERRIFAGRMIQPDVDPQTASEGLYPREDGATALASGSASASCHDALWENETYISRRGGRPSNSVVLLTLLTSLGGVLFGYDLGVIASALPGIADEFQLSTPSQEWVVSALYVGGGFGAALGGALCDAYGRRQAILGVDVAFVLGAALLASAAGLAQLVLGRVLVGFAVALSGLADVAYLSEISPAEFRGALVSVNEACISLGFLLSFVAGTVLGTGAWRVLFGMSGGVAVLQFVGMFSFMPESPVWLEKQGRFEEADAARRIVDPTAPSSPHSRRETSAPTSTTVPTYQTVGSADPSADDGHIHGVAVAAFTTAPHHRHHRAFLCSPVLGLAQQLVEFYRVATTRYAPQAWIALFLAAMQQLCGQTNVLSYAHHLLQGGELFDAGEGEVEGEDANGSNSDSGRWAPLYVGVVKFAVTCVVIVKIEGAGRRFFLLAGMVTISVGLVLLVLAFGVGGGDGSLSSSSSSSSSALVLPGMLLVVCGYSMSFGPLTWLLTSELFPSEIRGRALGCGTIVTYLCAALVTSTFLSLQTALGASAVFGFYLATTLLGCFFAYVAIPETKEKAPEEIEQSLRLMSWWADSSGGDDRRVSSSYVARRPGDDGGWDAPTCHGGQELPRLT